MIERRAKVITQTLHQGVVHILDEAGEVIEEHKCEKKHEDEQLAMMDAKALKEKL